MALKKNTIAFLLGSCLVAGCNNKTPDQALAAVEGMVDAKQYDAATIELKNAIDDNPENPLLRFRLGQIYFSQGRLTAAEKEFRVAYRNGYEPNDVIPKLAETLSLQYKSSELIKLSNEVRGLSPGAETTLKILTARAYLLLDNKDKAFEQLKLANDLTNESLYSGYAKALESYTEDNIDGALSILDNILRSEPQFAHALLLQGQLYSALGKHSLALESFRKYNDALPDLIFSRIYLADALIKNRQFNEANHVVEALLKSVPKSGFVNQLKAQIAYAESNFEETRLYAQKAINYGANNTVTHSLAGIAAYSLGNYELARHHLAPIVDRLPPDNPIQGIYAAILIQLGSVEAGERGFESLKLLNENNPGLLIDTGYQLVRQGHAESAREIISEIDAASIDDPGQIARLSLLKLSLKDERGMTILENALRETPDNQHLQLSLIQAKLGTGNNEEALNLISKYVKENPQDIRGWNMLGLVNVKLKDFPNAAMAHQKALNIDGTDLTSLVFFAKDSMRKGDQKLALEYFRKIAARDELYFPSLITHYLLEKKYGDVSKLFNRLKKFHESGENPQATLIYARLLAEEGKNEQSLATLEDYKPNKATPSSYWLLKVDLLKKINAIDKIEPLLVEWTREDSESGLAWRSLASYYESIGNVNRALKEVQNGLSTATSDLDNLKVLLAQYSIQRKEFSNAENTIAELTKAFGDTNPVVSLLRGQLLLSQGEYSRALPLLKANYEYHPSERGLILILNAMVQLQQLEEATALTKSFIENDANNLTAWLYLANIQLRAQSKEAINSYKHIISIDPENQIALNNLTAILNENDRSQEAIEIIENILPRLEKVPFIHELYASTLWQLGNHDSALQHYAKAFELSDKSSKYAKFYADALVKAGQDAYARKILSEAN